jgi:hypothetical protein
MKKGLCGTGVGIKLSLLGVAVLVACLAGAALAQGNQARMSVEPPEGSLKKGGPEFKVNIVVDDVANLAAFQFTLSYDPSIIKVVLDDQGRAKVKNGAFLGSTGREPQCTEPRVQTGQPETLSFNCSTLGPPVSLKGTAGPDGSGVLAEITFAPVGGGTTPLDLKDVMLLAAEIDEQGQPVEIETAAQGATLDVSSSGGGISWALWGPVIGVVAAVVVVGAIVVVVRLRGARGPGSLGGA